MVKENKLLSAVKSNNLSNVLKVLEKYTKQKSKNKNKKLDFEVRDNYGLTVVHHAARNGVVEILETLLIHGGQFEVFDLHGLRPISYACAEGHKKVVETLLRWGSSTNRISSIEFLTPLHLASMYGYAEIAHLLLQCKADITAVNRERRSALDLACIYGKYNVINVLLAYSANAQQHQQGMRMIMNANSNSNNCNGNNNSSNNSSSNMQSAPHQMIFPHTDSSFTGYVPQPTTHMMMMCGNPQQPTTPKVERYSSLMSPTRRSSSPYGGTSSNYSGGNTSNHSFHSAGASIGGAVGRTGLCVGAVTGGHCNSCCHCNCNNKSGSCHGNHATAVSLGSGSSGGCSGPGSGLHHSTVPSFQYCSPGGSGSCNMTVSSGSASHISGYAGSTSMAFGQLDENTVSAGAGDLNTSNSSAANLAIVTGATGNNVEFCIPPSLDWKQTELVSNNGSSDIRQNLREACFAVQARAVCSFYLTATKSLAINVKSGDLVTVLKRYHNGLAKGYVTSEGISKTGLFPEHIVEYIGSNRPPTCCDRPIERYVLSDKLQQQMSALCVQSPEKTPIPSSKKKNSGSSGGGNRPAYLELKTNNDIKSLSAAGDVEDDGDGDGDDDDDDEDEDEEDDNSNDIVEDAETSENNSPIEIPPQMTEIRTCVGSFTGRIVNSGGGGGGGGCTHVGNTAGVGGHQKCCHNHQQQQQCSRHNCCGGGGGGVNVYPSSPPLPLPIATFSSSTTPNKRNSIASMDSGRGSAADNKSVVSGGRAVSSGNSQQGGSSQNQQLPQSPVASNSSGSAGSNQGNCCCSNNGHQQQQMPQQLQQQTVQQQQQQQQQQFTTLPGHVSIDSLYHQCSMVSLDDGNHGNNAVCGGSISGDVHQISGTATSSISDSGMDDVMVTWLHYIGLGHHAECLYAAGYDMATLAKATPEDLNASGVTNPQDRQYLKSQLSRLSVGDGLPDSVPKSMSEFLSGLKLLQYEELLENQNFTQVEHLLGLSWEDLADIGIEKLGHQKKLSLAIERISRLISSNNSSGAGTSSNATNSSQEDVHQSQQPVQSGGTRSPNASSVSQSRSYEELPYPSAVMTSPDKVTNAFTTGQSPYHYGSTPRSHHIQRNAGFCNTLYCSDQPYHQQHHLQQLHQTDSLQQHTQQQHYQQQHDQYNFQQNAASHFCCNSTTLLSSHSDESVSSTMVTKQHHQQSVSKCSTLSSSSTSSCSQDDSNIGGCDDHQIFPRLLPHPYSNVSSVAATHFASDNNTGTVRVRKCPTNNPSSNSNNAAVGPSPMSLLPSNMILPTAAIASVPVGSSSTVPDN